MCNITFPHSVFIFLLRDRERVGVRVSVCAHVEARGGCLVSFCISTLGLDAGSDPEAHQFSEAGWPVNSRVLPLWESSALESRPHPAFHMNSGDLNLGPDVFTASTSLPSAPSAHNFDSIFYFGRSNQAIPC